MVLLNRCCLVDTKEAYEFQKIEEQFSQNKTYICLVP
jgi:hypothetical protein